METYTRSTVLFALAAATVASTLTAATARAAGAATAPPALAWHQCEGTDGPPGRECAELPVPLDYRDPDGPQLSLAVARLRGEGTAPRRGTLMAIPGGPGGSGVRRLTEKGQALREETEGQYDIVGFDPRGVGGSTRAGCGIAEEDRRLVTLRSWPAPDGGIGENVARSRRVAEACARNGGAVLRSFSTTNQVRDLDRLRQALGEERISAWATSYGAYVGAVYAQKYPERTDRWVLDSSGDPDPDRVGHGWLVNMGQGADDRFPDFAAWAADPPAEHRELRLAGRAEDVRPLVLELAAELDREPMASNTPGVPLTGNRLRQALQNALYSDDSFASLAGLVKAARTPAGDPPVLPGDLTQPIPDEDASLMVAVLCNDVRWPASVSSYRRAVAVDRVAHPLTAGMPSNVSPCAFWTDAPADKPTRITDDGPSDILMIQGLRDPATPYSGALKMRGAFGDRARMVTVGRGGHGMYLGNGNACGDRAVTEFLRDGRRPARDVSCPG